MSGHTQKQTQECGVIYTEFCCSVVVLLVPWPYWVSGVAIFYFYFYKPDLSHVITQIVSGDPLSFFL